MTPPPERPATPSGIGRPPPRPPADYYGQWRGGVPSGTLMPRSGSQGRDHLGARPAPARGVTTGVDAGGEPPRW